MTPGDTRRPFGDAQEGRRLPPVEPPHAGPPAEPLDPPGLNPPPDHADTIAPPTAPSAAESGFGTPVWRSFVRPMAWMPPAARPSLGEYPAHRRGVPGTLGTLRSRTYLLFGIAAAAAIPLVLGIADAGDGLHSGRGPSDAYANTLPAPVPSFPYPGSTNPDSTGPDSPGPGSSTSVPTEPGATASGPADIEVPSGTPPSGAPPFGAPPTSGPSAGKPTAHPPTMPHPPLTPGPPVVPEPPAPPQGPPRLPVSVEAEGPLTERSGSVVPQPFPGASGGMVVTRVGDGPANTVRFSAAVPADDHYTVTVHYVAAMRLKADVIVNGKRRTVVFPASSESGRIGTVSVRLKLTSGDNTIGFANQNAPAPDLDRIVIMSPR